MAETNKTQSLLDALKHLHVGDSNFESWFADCLLGSKCIKQIARESYAAGMEDPLVLSVLTAANAAQVSTSIRENLTLVDDSRISGLASDIEDAPVLNETDDRERIARAIWNIRMEEEDCCDVELEDLLRSHSVWAEADAVIAALSQTIAKDEPFAYFQRHPISGTWGQVMSSAAGEAGVVAAYTRPQPQELPVRSDDDNSDWSEIIDEINRVCDKDDEKALHRVIRALLSSKSAEGADK